MSRAAGKVHLLDDTDPNGSEHLTACGRDDVATVEQLTSCFAAVTCKRCQQNEHVMDYSRLRWRNGLERIRRDRSAARHLGNVVPLRASLDGTPR